MRNLFLLVLGAVLLLTACTSKKPAPQVSDAPQEPAAQPPQEAKTAVLSFRSFDGGGPQYEVQIDDPSVVSCSSSVSYDKADHENMTGAGYTVTCTFTGLKPGETTATVSARSPIADNYDAKYAVTVDDALSVTLTELEVIEGEQLFNTPVLSIEVDGSVFRAELADNRSARAFVKQLEFEDLTVELHDYGGFEKVGALPWELPRSDESITTEPGDVILYQGDQITLYYDENSWSLTRLAKIPDVTKDELLAAFGDGDVTAIFRIEWES